MSNGLSPATKLLLVIVATVLAAAVIVGGIYWASRSPDASIVPSAPPSTPDDPRLAYKGPYRNVRPEVEYVGDAVCAGCHEDKHASYRQHPMGRSVAPIEPAKLPPTDAKHNNPFTALGATFRVDRDGGRVFHKEIRGDVTNPVCENAIEAQYVIGSGNHGHSYLTDRNGYMYQTPISWFSHKQIWDISPGWSYAGAGRLVREQCLFCHANRVEHVEGTLNKYIEPIFRGQPAIGCERCHGPGALHVQRQLGHESYSKPDESIVNPRHLSPALREAVCQQCHLEGEERLPRRGRGMFDYRPGMPLEAFWAVVVHDGHNYNAVNHVEQMYQSKCFEKSSGKMGCISCHDPHVKPSEADRVPHFRKSCLACHESHGCSRPREQRLKSSPQDSCIDCHMARYPTADIAHTASTEHRIPRRPSPPPRKGPGSGITGVRMFFSRPHTQSAEDDRDFGVALAHLAYQFRLPPNLASSWEDPIDAALVRHPDDLDALEAKAMGNMINRRTALAVAALDRVLARAPTRETSLVLAAMLAQQSNESESALGYWRRAAEVNPWEPRYQAELARLFKTRSDWAAAKRHTDTWLKLDPSNVDARFLRVECLLREARRGEAANEFATIEKLAPRNLDELRRVYEQELKKNQ
jgi:hypothetical protein